MRVSIITAYYRNEDLTGKFLDNLQDKLPKDSEVVVVNAESIPIHHDIISKRVDLQKNYGFSHSMNAGIKAAKGEYLIIIGNDTFPQDKYWADDLIETHQKFNAGITAPDNSNPGLRKLNHLVLEDYPEHAVVRMFPAICWVLRRDLVEKVGLFDEDFGIGTYEDDDYCDRVSRLGLPVIVDKKVIVTHLLSKTMGLFDVHNIMRHNQQIFIRKRSVRDINDSKNKEKMPSNEG